MINRGLLLAVFVFGSTVGYCQKVGNVQSASAHVVLLPDFYHYGTEGKGDTTYTYDCYDKEMKSVRVDKLADVSSVKTIFYFKNYYAYPRKPGAMMSPPLLSKKMYKWERLDASTWLGVDNKELTQTRIREVRSKIVRADTVTITDLNSGKTQKVIHKYYKTTSSSGSGVSHSHTH